MEVFQQVLTHLVHSVTVAGHLLVEYTCPHESVQFVLWLAGCCAVHIEMEVKIASDREEIIFNILDLLEFSEDLYCVHLLSYHLVKCLDQLFSQLECKLILSEIPQPLVQKPYVHIRY